MNECKCLQRPKFCDCDVAKLEARIAELEKDAEELAARRWVEERLSHSGAAITVFFEGNPPAPMWRTEEDGVEYVAQSPVELAYMLGWRP